jgi:hypothetical protein
MLGVSFIGVGLLSFFAQDPKNIAETVGTRIEEADLKIIALFEITEEFEGYHVDILSKDDDAPFIFGVASNTSSMKGFKLGITEQEDDRFILNQNSLEILQIFSHSNPVVGMKALAKTYLKIKDQ